MNHLVRRLAAACLAAVASRADATVHRVLPGSSWDGISLTARPGDEIVLEPGVHRPARIADLAGEPGRPIVIRARDEKSLAEIRGGSRALELVRPNHVEIRNIHLHDSEAEGLVIAGDPGRPGRDVLVRNCLLSGCGTAGPRPAILLDRVEGVTIADSRVQGFESSAIEVDRCREVRIERAQILSSARGKGRTGITISGGTERVAIDRIGIGPSIQTAFAIGLHGPAGEEEVPDGAPLASRVTIRNAFTERNDRFASLGSARDVNLSRCTIIDPLDTVLLAVAPPEGHPAASGVRFRGNLISWTPNSLKRLSALGPGVEGRPGVEYGANLWHSMELPAALPLLGSWEGTVAEPQVTDLDPRLDNRGMPREESAKAFGVEPAAAGGSPVPVPTAR